MNTYKVNNVNVVVIVHTEKSIRKFAEVTTVLGSWEQLPKTFRAECQLGLTLMFSS